VGDITHIRIPTQLFSLSLTGIYELSIVALAYNFGAKGLTLSNGKIAAALQTDKRTIERALARLRKSGHIINYGTGRNDRCLKFNTDTMSVEDTDTMSAGIPTSGGVSTDTTADHNKVTKTATKKKDKSFSLEGDEIYLSSLLLELILKRKPDLKKPDLQKWAKEVGLMFTRDNRTKDRIEKVIRWCQADSFWQHNILSTNKLRKHFDLLESRANEQTSTTAQHTGTNGGSPAKSFIR
jgi:hypothetical protein